jgi:hypothetical protein
MKQNFFMIWSILLLVVLNSCNLDNLDLNNLSDDVNLNPTLAAPFAHANIASWDLFKSPNKVQSPDGIVSLVYRQNDLITFKVSDLLNLPTQQQLSSLGKEVSEISPGDFSRRKDITLSELSSSLDGGLIGLKAYNGMTVPFPAFIYSGPEVDYDLGLITEFTSISVSGGTLEISLENKLKVPVTIKGNLYDAGNNKVISDFTFGNVAPEGISKKTVSLAGLEVSYKVEFRLQTFETVGSATPVLIDMKDYLRVNFDMKDLKITKGNVIVKSQTIEGESGTLNVVFPEPEMKVFSAVLKKGKLNIRTNNSTKLTGNINLLLNEIRRNGQQIKSSIPINGSSVSIDLSGTEINFSSDLSNPYNRIPYNYSIQLDNSDGYIDFETGDELKMDITLADLDFQSLSGDFGPQKIQIAPGNFELNLFNKLGGDFKVANPKLSIIFHNSIGIPAEVSLDIASTSNKSETIKNAQTNNLLRNPANFNIPVPADIHSGFETGTIEYTKQNSNVVEFMSLTSNSKILYSGAIDFNKGNTVNALNPNFIDAESRISVDMALDLPMELQINSLSFSDTTGISGDSFDKVESAEVILTAKNGIPLDLDMQMLFVDTISKVQYGSSKRTKILSAAKIDASGNYIPLESSHSFTLDKIEMDNLRKANGVVFSGTVISPLGETGIVTILSESRIELKTVIKAKLNL